MKHGCLMKPCFAEQLSTAPVDVVGTASARCLRKSSSQSHHAKKRCDLIAERTRWWERPIQLGDKRCVGRALTQAVLSTSTSPRAARYKSPQGECLPIASQGLGKLEDKNIPSPRFNNPSRAANGKCYSGGNWGQPSVGTPWRYPAKW